MDICCMNTVLSVGSFVRSIIVILMYVLSVSALSTNAWMCIWYIAVFVCYINVFLCVFRIQELHTTLGNTSSC